MESEFMMSSSQAPPRNLVAEKSTLGSMILDRRAALCVLGILEPVDFYYEVHQRIYSVMQSLAERGESIDLVAVAEDLRGKDLLDATGGAAYLCTLLDSVPTAANAEYYARIVEGNALLRSEETDAADKTLLKAALGMVNEASARNTKDGYVTTGLLALDELTDGFKPGELWLLGARTSMGMTALLLNQARAIARTKRVLFVNGEQSRESLIWRLFGIASGIPNHRLSREVLSDSEKAKLQAAYEEIKAQPLEIHTENGISFQSAARIVHSEMDQRPVDLIILDNLSSLNTRELGRLKATAASLGVAILGSIHISRMLDRVDKRPILSDFQSRSTGESWEPFADGILGLHRNDYYEEVWNHSPSEVWQPAELIVMKNPCGPVATVQLDFLPERTCFRESSPPPGRSYSR